jgi:site-specific recombinase XerD
MQSDLLAPRLEAFFTRRLMADRDVSPNTVAAYRDTFRLLLRFAQRRLGKRASDIALSDLDASLITAFLHELEEVRHNKARTRNARLAAIRSFFHYLAVEEPTHAALIRRVLNVPLKRWTRRPIDFLNAAELQALLAAPDRSTWVGRRDHALILLAFQTGLRVSEIVGLRRRDVHLGRGAHVWCYGKGRKERCTPLRRDAATALRSWLDERDTPPEAPLFPAGQGQHLSRDSVERRLAKYSAIAREVCPSLRRKRISPHILRHSMAMDLLHHGVDRSVVALWLGHESVQTTEMYLQADMVLKERALARTAPISTGRGRYHADDALLAFLKSL